MAEWSLPRKPRKSNFSTDEVDVLVDSVKQHYNVLYGKFAKRATNRWIRHKAWMEILKKVNGVSIEKRTLQEVKNKWKKCQYAMKEKAIRETLADDPGDSSWDDMDSMPLQERLSKVAAQEKIAAGAAGQVLKSQPLSPTKLKVTRQGPKAGMPAEQPQSPVNEEMCLRWNSHHSNMQTAFPSILSKEQYVDVTLAAEGKTLKCHRLILSSCSPYFEEILSGISPFQHPVLFMRDIPFWILKSLCDFMYAGEVHIFQNKLEELLTVAEALKIKGLAGKSTPPENQEQSNKIENNSANNNHNTKESKKKTIQHEKEKIQHHLPPPFKKNPGFTQPNNFESTSHDYDDDLLDPLDLLEPLYEEAAEEKKPSTIVKPKENKYQYQPVKKPFTRRLRKRKFSEQREPSPPPVFSFRKGTRSRPNVKIPKYYHTDYSNPTKPTSNAQTDPLLDVEEIKTEPIDVEDNLIDYSDEDHYIENSLESTNCDSPIIITSTKLPPPLPPPQADKFKKIKLTKPIITEVHTIGEANTTAGGLEVIKITVQPPEDVRKEGEKDSLQGVSLTEKAVSDVPVDTLVSPTESREESFEKKPEAITPEDEVEAPSQIREEFQVSVREDEVESSSQIREEVQEPIEEGDEMKAPTQIREEVQESVERGKMVETLVEREEAPVPEGEQAEASVVERRELTEEARVEEEGTMKETESIGANVSEPVMENVVDEAKIPTDEESITEEETGIEQAASDKKYAENEHIHRIQPQQEIQIQDVRSTATDQVDEQAEEEERRTTSLNHLEKEAMNVVNAINLENQEEPPDIQ